jgi:hypothetical protein
MKTDTGGNSRRALQVVVGVDGVFVDDVRRFRRKHAVVQSDLTVLVRIRTGDRVRKTFFSEPIVKWPNKLDR